MLVSLLLIVPLMRFKAAMRSAAEEAAKKAAAGPGAPGKVEVGAEDGSAVMDEEGEEEEPKATDEELPFDAD